jgi:hypothetical protein
MGRFILTAIVIATDINATSSMAVQLSVLLRLIILIKGVVSDNSWTSKHGRAATVDLLVCSVMVTGT